MPQKGKRRTESARSKKAGGLYFLSSEEVRLSDEIELSILVFIFRGLVFVSSDDLKCLSAEDEGESTSNNLIITWMMGEMD